MKIIYKDGTVAECPEEEVQHVLRHSAAHIMAQAIQRLFPEADFAYGPATEKGFYYDVDLGDRKLTDEDLANIEKEMKKIVKENVPIKPFILSRDEAVKLVQERDGNLDPKCVEDFCNFLGYRESEFWAIVDKFYNTDLFKKDQFGEWVLKDPVH